jgi:hypothetical protein
MRHDLGLFFVERKEQMTTMGKAERLDEAIAKMSTSIGVL